MWKSPGVLFATLALLSCSGAVSAPASAIGPEIAASGPAAPPSPAPSDAEPLPKRPLDAWEEGCVTEARAAEGNPHAAGHGCVKIVLDNTMSSGFQLMKVEISLEGQGIFAREDRDSTTDLSTLPSLPVFQGKVAPGDRELTVHLVYRGICSGIYDYCRGYKFDIKSHHVLSVPAARAMEVHAVAYERGGVTTPLEERPAMKYREGVL